jgi:hypothetical protein
MGTLATGEGDFWGEISQEKAATCTEDVVSDGPSDTHEVRHWPGLILDIFWIRDLSSTNPCQWLAGLLFWLLWP